MRIIDISQELFSSKVFPGDPEPEHERVCSIMKGDGCNLTKLSMCAHNGTHIDAPIHFIDGGGSVAEIPTDKCYGDAYVLESNHTVDAEFIKNNVPPHASRILIKGGASLTPDGAEEAVRRKIVLIGVETQSIGEWENCRPVHMLLLGAGVVVLEGIVLSGVAPGKYTLCAMPLKMSGCDGSPCRAVLIT